MSRNELLNFQIIVDDIIYGLNTKDADKLERLSIELHEAVENSFYDYCMENEIEDYDAMF